jgi:pimeloyl-ACP methyl ester carboxylesterase
VAAYGSDELVADVVAIASELGAERFHLVGHDWGGAVAWQVAGRHPGRVRTLTVLSTPHPRAFAVSLGLDPDQPESHHGADGGPSDRASDQAARSSYIEIFRAEGAELGMLANDAAGLRLVLCGTGLSEDEAAPYLAALGTPDALGAALNWYRAATLASAADMGAITMPTAYLWSTDDPALGRDAADATAACVEGPYRFEVFDDVGHWIAEQAPERTTAVLLDQLALA